MKRSIIAAVAAIGVVLALVSISVVAPGVQTSPLPSFNFVVQIDGIAQTSFQSVSGLSCTTEVIEYRNGNDNTITLLPGITRCGPIVLRGGLTDNHELWDWYEQTVSGNLVRKSGSVVVLDYNKVEKARFNFYDAWPMAYNVTSLDASSKGVLIESLTLAVGSIVRQ